MSLEERLYSVLVVSSAEKLNTALSDMLPRSEYRPVHTVSSISAAKRIWANRSFDFVIINSPLSDDDGTRFAIDAASSPSAVVLMLVAADLYDAVREETAPFGVFTLSRPFNRLLFSYALDWMSSARERLRKAEKKTLSVEEKMEEIRIVNRAKWLLITELKMEEPQAHRYIEKQAMDHSISKKKAAEEIIRLYT